MPYFFNPRLDAHIPILSLLAELEARIAARLASPEDPSDQIFSVYGRNAWKSGLRVHLDVSAAGVVLRAEHFRHRGSSSKPYQCWASVCWARFMTRWCARWPVKTGDRLADLETVSNDTGAVFITAASLWFREYNRLVDFGW